MKFFSFDDIKSAADCVDVARQIGLDVVDGRCAARWRDGTNDTSVSMNRDGWHDFAREESGSVIDLVALVQFGGDRQRAQEWLGEYLRLTPVYDKLAPSPAASETRYHKLIERGFTETKRYCYRDEHGEPLHYTIRMEHPSEPKEFVQMSADGRWTLKGTRLVLYNLGAIIASSWAVIVEGEKDADNLINLGIPATTNAMGAKKWLPEYSEVLRGKKIVIIADNDEPGKIHADLVAGHLCNIAASVRIIVISSIPKGDVTDWIEFEGGSKELLLDKIKQSRPIDMRIIDEQFQLTRAKEANKQPFRNYTIDVVESNLNKKFMKTPIQINAIISDIYTRFLGFPRRVGEELFDRDKDCGAINYIHTSQQLFAWICQKSKQITEWSRDTGMVSMEQLFEGLKYASPRYEAISQTPDWPRRHDVYYCHRPLPAPSQGHGVFEQLIDFFAPESPEYRPLIRAMIAAPLYYEQMVSRPMWIIDSESPGAGKSTLATRTAMLYGAPAVEVKTRDFERDMQEVTKRLVSPDGRQSRILLVDNVIGTFGSEELASMVTIPYITGRPAYGRNEERRPNNLTYIITANNASIDNDLSIRAFFIRLRSIDNYDPGWSDRLTRFIAANRLQIFADIVDMLDNPTTQTGEAPFTRFPEFEVKILRAMCRNETEYLGAITKITESRSSANVESEYGKVIEDVITAKLAELNLAGRSAFIRSQVIDEWLAKSFPSRRQSIVQFVRNIARSGHCDSIDPKRDRYPLRGDYSRRGLMWIGRDAEKNPREIVAKHGDSTVVIEI